MSPEQVFSIAAEFRFGSAGLLLYFAVRAIRARSFTVSTSAF